MSHPRWSQVHSAWLGLVLALEEQLPCLFSFLMFELEGMAVEGGSWQQMPFAAGWPPDMLHQIQGYGSLGIVVGSLKNQELDLELVFAMDGFHAERQGLDME